MQKSCALCNGEIGFFTSKTEIADGYICKKCLKKAGIDDYDTAYSFTSNQAREMLDRRIPLVKKFKVTKKYSDRLQIDEKNKAFKVQGQIFEYSDLLDFQLLEDGQTIAIDKIGLAKTAVGGLLFGGVGAFIGAVTGPKLLSGVCNSMELKIILRNTYTNEVTIPFIIEKTRKRSDEYKIAQEVVQSCITALMIIDDYNKQQEKSTTLDSSLNININTSVNSNSTTTSGADEIVKYKTLLDAGIITQEEFEAKKKQILET